MPRLQRAYVPMGTAMREGRRVFIDSDDLVEDTVLRGDAGADLDVDDEDAGYHGLDPVQLAVARARGDFDWS